MSVGTKQALRPVSCLTNPSALHGARWKEREFTLIPAQKWLKARTGACVLIINYEAKYPGTFFYGEENA